MSDLRPASPRVPGIIVALAVVALAYILGPIIALGTRVPWAQLGSILVQDSTRELLGLTLSAAVLSSLIAILLGVPLAVWMQPWSRGGQFARLLVLLPLAMPPVVSGLALSAAVGNRGLLTPVLDALNIQFAFAFPGVVAAHVFVSLPFVIVTVDSALRQIDKEVTFSAAGVGMSPFRILRHITFPTIAPAIITGTGLAFARSLGEFGTTITFAGSMPGVTRTMSIAVYLEREVDRASAYGLSAILIGLAIIALAIAFLPTLLQRNPSSKARSIEEMDVERLRELTAPSQPLSVSVNGTHFPAGSLSAVVGPNGSGKTTFMALAAGRIKGAKVLIGDRDVSTAALHTRGTILLTQRPGLPRTTTVAGALTMVTRDVTRTSELLHAAGLSQLSDVPVPDLSGGQAAQVSLVRALSQRPAVLLLDEPLAAIDVASASLWRKLLRATATDRTTIMVTHDPIDIAGLSNNLVIIEEGAVLTSGPTQKLLQVPPNDFVATLANLNRLTGEVIDISNDTVTLRTSDGMEICGITAQGTLLEIGHTAVATFEPSATTLFTEEKPTKGSARNAWQGRVMHLLPSGASEVTVTIALGSQHIRVPITPLSAVNLGLEEGRAVHCRTKALALTVHPSHSHPPER